MLKGAVSKNGGAGTINIAAADLNSTEMVINATHAALDVTKKLTLAHGNTTTFLLVGTAAIAAINKCHQQHRGQPGGCDW